MPDTTYSLPEIYEIAFDFRDYEKAVDFLTDAAARAGLTRIDSMVELGCGPGQYCREFARRDIRAFGVDLSPEMVAYASGICQENDLPCEILRADMTDFSLPQKVDLACCMMATIHLLLTNNDLINHLRAVADCLTGRGLYIIELSHASDIFGKSRAKNQWTIKRDYTEVTTNWASDAVTDATTEIATGTVTFDVKHPTRTDHYEFTERFRHITAGLLRALIAQSGCFEIVSWYGDLDLDIPFDNSDSAWRMLPVLRKR